MKMRSLVLTVLLVGAGLAGCSTQLAQRAQRADGLMDFLTGNPGEVGVPVEVIAGGGAAIEAARVRVYAKAAFVSGYVARSSPGGPRPAAHVDVLVFNARKRLLESHLADYLPRSIPHGQHGGSAHSSFTVRLKAPPPTGATVQVIFHNQAKSSCPHKANSP